VDLPFRKCTPKLPCILHSPCFILWTLTPGCFCAFNCCIHFSFRLTYCFCRFLCLLFCACSYTVFLRVSSRETIHANFSVGGHSYIVDLPFRITTCRFLLAIVFRTWDLVCINLSFASKDFVCPRMTSIRIAIGFVHRRGHHAFRESSFVSLVHRPRQLFLLSHHRKAFLLLLIRSLL